VCRVLMTQPRTALLMAGVMPCVQGETHNPIHADATEEIVRAVLTRVHGPGHDVRELVKDRVNHVPTSERKSPRIAELIAPANRPGKSHITSRRDVGPSARQALPRHVARLLVIEIQPARLEAPQPVPQPNRDHGAQRASTRER
jgi:hypothetical protein